jgi:hypothetical protein
MLETPTPKLYELSDAHIDVCNRQADTHNPKLVSAGSTLAAAKYAAFFCKVASQSREEMVSKREASIEFFSDEFRKMFAAEYDSYIQNYDAGKS